MNIAIVTASTDPLKTARWWGSWRRFTKWPLVLVVNGTKDKYSAHHDKLLQTLGNEGAVEEGDLVDFNEEYLGTVPAFAQGYELASRLVPRPDIIACFHDDLRIDRADWDLQVKQVFRDEPECFLAGFGGAMGVGSADMYERPFDPMTLARHNFGSNLDDAEAHGERWPVRRRVAVLDGFSLIFRNESAGENRPANVFAQFARSGILHHAYDVGMGAYMRRHKRETWFVPVFCHHAGGQTAVGDPGWETHARTLFEHGDQGVWLEAHRIVYESFRDVLPFGIHP